MSVRLINPQGLPDAGVYQHVAIATGSRTIYLAGQVAWDGEGKTVAEDLESQVLQCYRNVATALSCADASFDDVVKLTVYITGWTTERLSPLVAGVERAREELGISANPPLTLLGVEALHIPEHLVEIEAIAVVD